MTSLMMRTIIIYFCSRLTIKHVIEADSLLIRAYYTHVVKLVLFMLLKFLSLTSDSDFEIADFNSDNELNQEINCCLLFHVYYMHVAELLLSIVELQKLTQLESKSLSCDMYEALNNVRIMSKASHKDTSKRRSK